jgi:2-oxoglutarate dehydrogenase E2 component (dihydrolipoamide succinyltransferase)
MRIEIKVPELSESVQSGTLLEWRKQVGDPVKRDEVLADLETDKVILEVTSPSTGVLAAIQVPATEEVLAGAVLGVIETDETQAAVTSPETAATEPGAQISPATPMEAPAKPATQGAVAPPTDSTASMSQHLRPSARKALVEAQPKASVFVETQPVQATPRPDAPIPKVAAQPSAAQASAPSPCPPCPPASSERGERRVPMTRLRQRIAERLKEAQNSAAILTTFNEIDMRPVQELRGRYQERFQKEHGVKLGFMSFFVKAACQSLKQFPGVNASVEGRDIVYHDYYDIGVAVSSERGLVVPVLRNADQLSFAEIEKMIADFGKRANSLQLSIEELEGGTFTISNGGIFGSLLSTPILNPPQSGVLGLHKIQDRPIAENGQVVIRPMMYVALSYDHRIIDGREAVSFLRAMKEALEDPARLLLEL